MFLAAEVTRDSMTLDVGFLGHRFMGRAHANALARLPMFFPDAPATNLDVVVGRDESALATAVDRLGFDRCATDWREVLDEVDVLYNLAPNRLHVEPSIAALDAGTHVLCEKPLAHTLSAAERMAEAARRSDATAGTAFNYRFVPAVQYAKRLVEEGFLGDLRHVRATYLQDWLVDPEEPWSWRNDAELAGSGALGDLGAHSLDLARFLTGDDVERLSGHLRTFTEERPVEGGGGDGGGSDGGNPETRPVTVDDAYTAQVEFASGATGLFEASRVAPGRANANEVELDGTGGSIRFDLERLNELEVCGADDRGFETVLVTGEDDPYLDRWWPPGHVLGWEHAHVHENYEFLTAAAEGESFAPDFRDGLDVQRLLDAIQRSDERGEWVSV